MRTPAPPPTPDEEALYLVMRLAERALVAKSFTRICAGLVTAHVARASQLFTSDVARVAKAAAEVAVQMTSNEIRRAAAPRPDDEPPSSKKKPTEEKRPDTHDADDPPSSLDHEALHDDAC